MADFQQDIFGGETKLVADKPKAAVVVSQGRLGLDGLDDEVIPTIAMRLEA